MRIRATIGAAFALFVMDGAWSAARAQQPASLGQATAQSGWVVNIAPYLWLPTVNTTLNYNLPANLGGRLPTDVSVGPGDLLSHLDFAAMGAAEARNGPFSLLTDFVYTRVSVGLDDTRIKSVDFFGLSPIPISRSLQTSLSTTLGVTVWTLAGGYTVLRGDWGNVDVIGGFRLLAVNARTDYSLALTLTGPRGNGATFGGLGGVNTDKDIWNGIAGIRGRIRLGDTRFFVPYYADVGGGGSQPTWQISAGLGYQTKWAALSASYRYLAFEQGGNASVQRVALRGPVLMVDFSF